MYAQHGDLLLKRADTIPTEAVELPHLRLLESVGRDNAHRFAEGSAAVLFKYGETIFVTISDAAQLVHDEHKPITIPPGIWVMDRVREYNPETDEVRLVVD